MPSPVTFETLKALIPKVGDKLCDKLASGITGYMQEVANYFRWMYRDDGTFSADFAAEICALTCVGNGNSDPDVPCPVISLTASSTVSDEAAHLTFNGTNMVAGYTYSIYRKVLESDAWGAAIATGTTTGSVITYDNTGLTNGTAYRYKCEVQKGGCEMYSVELNGVTPVECQALSFTLSGGADTRYPGGVRFTLVENGGLMTDDFVVTVYASNTPGDLGSPILATTTVGASGFKGTVGNNIPAFVPEWILNPALTYYFTFVVKETASCTEYTKTSGAVTPSPAVPNPVFMAPTRVVGGSILQFSGTVNPQAPPLQLQLWVQSVGNQDVGIPTEGFIAKAVFVVPSGGLPFSVTVTKIQLPINFFDGVAVRAARYLAYVIAVGPRGAQSIQSDTRLIEFQTNA